MCILRQKSPLRRNHFFGQLKPAFLLTDCETTTSKSLEI